MTPVTSRRTRAASHTSPSIRGFVVAVTATVVLLVSLIAGLNWVVDPWRYLRDSELASYDSDGRQQNLGLIRHKSYGAIVLGTSMTQNFDPVQIERLFGDPALVLSISAGTAREQFLTGRNALATQPVKTVIWGIHPGAFSVTASATKGNAFPAYLYEPRWNSDLFYLFNWSNTEKSLEDLQAWWAGGAEREEPVINETWRNLQAWGHRYRYGCPHLMELQLGASGLPAREDDLRIDSAAIDNNLVTNVLALVRRHPDTRFELFFPPISQLYWRLIEARQPARFALYLDTYTKLATLLRAEANVRIHDFSGLPGVVDNLSHYKDITHFSPAISAQLLRLIREGGHAVGDVSAYIPGIARLLSRGDDRTLESRVQACLSANN